MTLDMIWSSVVLLAMWCAVQSTQLFEPPCVCMCYVLSAVCCWYWRSGWRSCWWSAGLTVQQVISINPEVRIVEGGAKGMRGVGAAALFGGTLCVEEGETWRVFGCHPGQQIPMFTCSPTGRPGPCADCRTGKHCVDMHRVLTCSQGTQPAAPTPM